MLFPNQVIRADDLAQAMVNVVVPKTAKRENRVFENRDIRAMVDSFHAPTDDSNTSATATEHSGVE